MLFLLMACGGITAVPDKDSSPTAAKDSAARDSSGDPLDSQNHDGNRAPFADAGQNINGAPSTVIALDGSGSRDPDGDPITYAWDLVDAPNGSQVQLINATRLDAQFVPDKAGIYRVELIVSDGVLASEPDDVDITIVEANGTPVASAGPDQSVAVGDLVSLDGSGSVDPDGDNLRFSWTLSSAPAGSAASLSNASSSSPRFTADVAGTYQVSLMVSDGTLSATDTMRVTTSSGGGGGGGGGSSCGGCAALPVASPVALLLALLPFWQRRRR